MKETLPSNAVAQLTDGRSDMRIVILGAGALGSAVGATLAGGGASVTLVTRNRAQLNAIERSGLTVRAPSGAHTADRVVRVAVAPDCSDLTVADVVVVLVKSFDTRAAIEGAGPVLGPDTVLLTLQNGLGHEEILADVVARSRILLGVTYAGARWVEPAIVSAGLVGRRTIVGDLDGPGPSAIARQLADAFTRFGLPTEASANIDTARWDKLLTNSATGALAAITGLSYDRLYAVPQVQECAQAAVAEGIAVAAALRIPLSSNDPQHIWENAAAGLPPDFKTSMLQSIEAGSRTEIDAINGALVRAGERAGTPTPVNRTLVAAVKGREAALEGTAL